MSSTPSNLPSLDQTIAPIRHPLSDHLGLTVAGRLRDTFADVASRNTDVEIDCHAVNYLDTSALQLLIGLEGECGHRQQDLQLINVSTELQNHLARVGLVGRFNMQADNYR